MNTAENTVTPFIEQAQTPAMPHQPTAIITPMAMLDRAVASNASIETLERLMALYERNEELQARREFDEALAAAKAEIPTIIKNQKVDFTSQKGRTNYNYENLSDIAAVVDPILSKNGLSYRFRTKQVDRSVVVTCIISHRRGHREENELPGFADETGNKNSIQAIGSTITYLQRYTLKAALGLSASNDTDGKQPEPPSKLIDDAQFRYIQDLIEKASADETKMLSHLGATDLVTLTQAQYRTAEALLRKKISQNEAKKKEVA